MDMRRPKRREQRQTTVQSIELRGCPNKTFWTAPMTILSRITAGDRLIVEVFDELLAAREHEAGDDHQQQERSDHQPDGRLA
jgi:hypothetical protein